ncbi:MAG: hypothetical protein ACTSRZ_08755 [Promethearchaeota archaeon]
MTKHNYVNFKNQRAFSREHYYVLIMPILVISAISFGGSIYLDINKVRIIENTPLRQFEENVYLEALEQAKSLDMYFYSINNLLNSLGQNVEEILNNNETTDRQSYYHNQSVQSPPPLEYSQKHKQYVGFGYSAYKVANTSYNNPIAYMTLPDNDTFGDWNSTIDNLINITAKMDYMLIATYGSNDDILWVYCGFKEGLHRTYPYHGPFSKEYDPRVRPWYKTGVNTIEGHINYTTPYADATTNFVVCTAIYVVRDASSNVDAVIGIDFLLTTIQSQVLTLQTSSKRPFLINSQFNVLAHPDHLAPNATWHSSDLEVPITSLETNDIKFQYLLSNASYGMNGWDTIDYGNGDQRVVAMIQLNYTDLIFGLSVSLSSQETVPFIFNPFTTTFLIIAISSAAILIFQKYKGDNQLYSFELNKTELSKKSDISSNKASERISAQKSSNQKIVKEPELEAKKTLQTPSKSSNGEYFCIYCGEKIDPRNQNFCPYCGMKLDWYNI